MPYTSVSYKYALFITGNPGSGKSFIANNLGANFHSGFSEHGRGVTTAVQEEPIRIIEDDVLMIDAPGLLEADLVATQQNAELISEAIRRGHPTPYKIGVVVTDHNGRIQQADMLLIKKLHEALTPKFELFLIVNQIKKRNLNEYMTTECLENLIATIEASTGAQISSECVVAIGDCEDGEVVDMGPLIQALTTVPAVVVQSVDTIMISGAEFQTIGEKVLFHRFTQLKQVVAQLPAAVPSISSISVPCAKGLICSIASMLPSGLRYDNRERSQEMPPTTKSRTGVPPQSQSESTQYSQKNPSSVHKDYGLAPRTPSHSYNAAPAYGVATSSHLCHLPASDPQLGSEHVLGVPAFRTDTGHPQHTEWANVQEYPQHTMSANVQEHSQHTESVVAPGASNPFTEVNPWDGSDAYNSPEGLQPPLIL